MSFKNMANTESIYYTPETNSTVYIKCTSIEKKNMRNVLSL